MIVIDTRFLQYPLTRIQAFAALRRPIVSWFRGFLDLPFLLLTRKA